MCQKLQIVVYIDEIVGDWIALIRYALFHIIEVSFVLIVLGRNIFEHPYPEKFMEPPLSFIIMVIYTVLMGLT